MLERFENLQNDYDALAETHDECSALKEEHNGCKQRVKTLEDERNSLSVVNRDQASRIQELEAEVARTESALAAT
ncbi:hypothetical protein Tco_0839802 [Tanacetum coccineum]|uniref:Uncharacterized protein n=1 Tax=Tanacetum coccineum TaxID=301880 RepID=A0ABQ5ASB5_9ASTR